MNGDNGIIKQLRAAIEEDRQVIRKLRQEVDRLRYLLGLQSLKGAKPNSDSASGARSQFQAEFSN